MHVRRVVTGHDAAGKADIAHRALFGDVFEETCFGHGAAILPGGACVRMAGQRLYRGVPIRRGLAPSLLGRGLASRLSRAPSTAYRRSPSPVNGGGCAVTEVARPLSFPRGCSPPRHAHR